MKLLSILVLCLFVVHAQNNGRNAQQLPDAASNLPQQNIGVDDLLGISVYDAPELTRTLRVAGDGSLSLPMVKKKILVSGMLPEQVESAISRVLKEEELLVAPVVTVSVIEYRSRPISVVGAVKKPIAFQATGALTLLEAISRAEGFSEEAGSEILITRMEPNSKGNHLSRVQRIPIRGLIDAADAELNIQLQGGEEIRVPAAGKIFVVGNVKKPGSFPIRDTGETSVMKALAVSEGLMPYASELAYIYRRDEASQQKQEIAVELQKIMKRKSPDVPLMANDILYVPDRSGKRVAVTSLERLLSIGTGFGTAAILVSR